MPWKVARAHWLAVEADRVQAIIEMPKFWHRAWTLESLHAALEEIHMFYSMQDVEAINDELHARGVVEDLPLPPLPPP
jgi:hypothetical protein